MEKPKNPMTIHIFLNNRFIFQFLNSFCGWSGKIYCFKISILLFHFNYQILFYFVRNSILSGSYSLCRHSALFQNGRKICTRWLNAWECMAPASWIMIVARWCIVSNELLCLLGFHFTIVLEQELNWRSGEWEPGIGNHRMGTCLQPIWIPL